MTDLQRQQIVDDAIKSVAAYKSVRISASFGRVMQIQNVGDINQTHMERVKADVVESGKYIVVPTEPGYDYFLSLNPDYRINESIISTNESSITANSSNIVTNASIRSLNDFQKWVLGTRWPTLRPS